MYQVRIERPMDQEKMRALRNGLTVECVRLGVVPSASSELLVAADELCCNVMEHSNAGWMEVRLERPEEGTLSLVISDDGEEFNPVEAAELFDKPVYGFGADRHLGLWMLKQTTMSVSYQRCDGKINEMTVKAKISKEGNEPKGGA